MIMMAMGCLQDTFKAVANAAEPPIQQVENPLSCSFLYPAQSRSRWCIVRVGFLK